MIEWYKSLNGFSEEFKKKFSISQLVKNFHIIILFIFTDQLYREISMCQDFSIIKLLDHENTLISFYLIKYFLMNKILLL
jgi:hypothetical protein